MASRTARGRLVAVVAALGAAVAAAEVARPLDLVALRDTSGGLEIRGTFGGPADEAARDLRGATIEARVADAEPLVLAPGTPGLRIDRRGRRARFRALRGASHPVVALRIEPTQGRVQLRVAGMRADFARPPRVEVSFGGIAYLFERTAAGPPAPPPPPGPSPSPPAQEASDPVAVPFVSVARGQAILSGTTPVATVILRSASDVAALRTSLRADTLVPELDAVDFGRHAVVFAAGRQPLVNTPPSVTVTGVTDDGRELVVTLHTSREVIRGTAVVGGAPSVFTATQCYHAVRIDVPRGTSVRTVPAPGSH